MQREIVCSACAAKVRGLDLEDLIRGLIARHSTVLLKRSEDQLEIVCDRCLAVMPDGSTAKAVTIWNTRREPDPQMWERLYGTVTASEVIGSLVSKTTVNTSQDNKNGKPN